MDSCHIVNLDDELAWAFSFATSSKLPCYAFVLPFDGSTCIHLMYESDLSHSSSESRSEL
jgi:hypothetical protein